MKFEELAKLAKKLGAPLPTTGSGSNGKILNSDIEQAIARYVHSQETPSWGMRQRLNIGYPMLAMRYQDLNNTLQEEIWEDDTQWVAEEKHDGVRIMLFFHPTEGASAFGRNRSKKDCLPIEYTNNLLLNGKPLREFKAQYCCMLDCELTTDGYTELPDGTYASGRQAVTAIISMSDSSHAINRQIDCRLQFNAFDCILFRDDKPLLQEKYINRRTQLELFTKQHPNAGLVKTPFHYFDKRKLYNRILDKGGEGVVFKHTQGVYVPSVNGYRSKSVVKCKRSVVQSNASDIDCWIAGGIATDEYAKRHKVGALELHCYLKECDGSLTEHWLATVSSMPDAIRDRISDNEGNLREEYVGQVVTVDGQDISSRNRRINHAKVDWNIGFRVDKGPDDCIIDADFIDSQVF